MERLPLTCDTVFTALLAMVCEYDRLVDDRPTTVFTARFRQLPHTEGQFEVQVHYYPNDAVEVVLVNALNFAIEAAMHYLNNRSEMHPGGPLVIMVKDGDSLQAEPFFSLPAVERNPLAAWIQTVRVDVFDGARDPSASRERKLPGVRAYLSTGRFHNNYTVRSRGLLMDQLQEALNETFEGLRLAPTIPQDVVNMTTNQQFSRDPA